MSQCYEKAIFFIEEDKAVEWPSRCIRLTKIRKYWPTSQTEKEQREHRPLRMWVCSVIWKYLHLFVLVEQCWGWFKTYNHIYNWRPLQNGDGEVCTRGASSIASPELKPISFSIVIKAVFCGSRLHLICECVKYESGNWTAPQCASYWFPQIWELKYL